MNEVERVRRFARLRALVEAALEISPIERDAWLERLAEEDEALMEQVRDLVRRAQSAQETGEPN